jgi:hypothetical protein
MWLFLELAVGLIMFGISQSQQDKYMDEMNKQLDENKKTGHKSQKDNTENLVINNAMGLSKGFSPPP